MDYLIRNNLSFAAQTIEISQKLWILQGKYYQILQNYY